MKRLIVLAVLAIGAAAMASTSWPTGEATFPVQVEHWPSWPQC